MKKDFLDLKDINKDLKDDCALHIRLGENRYAEQLEKIAREVLDNGAKIVLLAGPTCAGKTTSARLLREKLEEYKHNVITISMDDFFHNYVDTPSLPDGSKDLESPNAVNIPQMEECFRELFEKKHAFFPRYDFISGKNIPNEYEYTISDDTIIILEGLHTLNPEISEKFNFTKTFKIFVSALSGFKYYNLSMDTRNLRLLRRTVRDIKKRGYDPMETLKMWEKVVIAEDEYIVPFADNADAYINTTHPYELAMYRDFFLSLMEKYPEAKDSMPFTELVSKSISLSKSLLPDTSLLWEFLTKD